MTHRIIRWFTSHRAFIIFLAAAAFEGLATVIYQFSMPADLAHSVLFGYSLRRLAVIALVFIVTLCFAALAIKAGRNALWAEGLLAFLSHRKAFSVILISLSVLMSLTAFTLVLTPPLRFMPYDLIFKGFLPPLTLAAVISAEAAFLLVCQRYGIRFDRLKRVLHEDNRLLRASLIVIAIIIAAWAYIAASGTGLAPDVAYWNAAGVPILAVQVLSAWLVSAGFLAAGLRPVSEKQADNLPPKKTERRWRHLDLAICIVLWGLSAVLWIIEPQVRSFFAPGPSQPNIEFYPLSDAAGYDIASQYALIGQGLDNGHHVDKPLYSTFLIFLHLLAGQDYNRLVMFQSAFLALIPVMLYLLGKALHSRPAGVLAGLLGAFKGKNAIASAWMVLSANPKLLISEYPMALGILVFTFFFVKWLKNPNKTTIAGMLAGSMFGLNTMIRHNIWILLPFVVLLLWLAAGTNWRALLRSSIIFLGMLLVTVLPWIMRTYNEIGSPFYFLPMLQNVFSQRYDINLPGTSWSTPIAPVPTVSSDAAVPTATTDSNRRDTGDLFTLSYTWHDEAGIGKGTFDDTDNAIFYSDNWFVLEDERAHQQTLHYSTVIGNDLHLNFAGEQITLVYPVRTGFGTMEILIDGEVVDTLVQSEGDPQNFRHWNSPNLINDRHELVLTHAGGSMVVLDAIIVASPPVSYQRSNECPSGVPYRWIHANQDSGLHVDDGVVPHQLPFTFRLNGEPYDVIYISTNGLVSFQEFNAGLPQPSIIPDQAPPDEFIAPFWMDLDASAGGAVLFDIFGVKPNRLFMVEWREVPLKSGEGSATFEMILFEGTSDILIQYGEMPPAEVTSQAIVGLEYGLGLDGTPVDNTVYQPVHTGLSLLFSNVGRECLTCYDVQATAVPADAGVVRMLPLPNCGNKYVEGTQLNLAAAAGKYAYQWAESVTASSMREGRTLPAGPAKVDTCGENQNAWSASKWGYQQEWLLLTYPQTVYAAGISIHETNMSGFVTQIDFLEENGASHTVWQGTETTTCGEWFTPVLDLEGITTEYKVKQVKIYTQKWGFEELDAVKLFHLDESGYRFETWNTNQQGSSQSLEVKNSMRLTAGFSEAAEDNAVDEPEAPVEHGKQPVTSTPQPVDDDSEKIHEGSSFSAAEDDTAMSWFVPSHFVHNYISSALILPTTIINDDLRNIITSPSSIWSEEWRGGLTVLGFLLMIFNLAVIALGTGSSWTHWRYAGLAPWITFFGYSLGTALARTSGGRYIVPIDWVFYLYYAIGLVQLSIWLFGLLGFRFAQYTRNEQIAGIGLGETSAKEQNFLQKNSRIMLVFLICLLLGTSPLLADRVFSPHFEELSKEQAYIALIERGAVEKLDLDAAEFAAFVHDEDSFVWMGRVLYPRFYQAGDGEPTGGVYGYMDFPRLVFTFIGQGGPNEGGRAFNGIIPLSEAPQYLPQAADAFLIGCRTSGANVMAIVLMDDAGDVVYQRTPESPLTCPLSVPVCKDGKCR